MQESSFENFPVGKEEFMSQVRLALADVLSLYKNKPNLLRPRVNGCLEENFGIRSRDVNLRIHESSQSFVVQFPHPVHGDMTFEV